MAYTPEQQATDLICDAQKFVLAESQQSALLDLVKNCGNHTLVLLDGPPGSGKTTVANLFSLLANQSQATTATTTSAATTAHAPFGSFRRSTPSAPQVVSSVSQSLLNNQVLGERLQWVIQQDDFQTMLATWQVSYTHIPDAGSVEEWLEEGKRRQDAPLSGKQQPGSRFAKIFRKLMPPRGERRGGDTAVELDDLYVQMLREYLLVPASPTASANANATTTTGGQRTLGQKVPKTVPGAARKPRHIHIVDNVDALDNLCCGDEAFSNAVKLVWTEALQELEPKPSALTRTQSGSRLSEGTPATCILLVTTSPFARERFTILNNARVRDCAVVAWPDIRKSELNESVWKYTGGRLSLWQKWFELREDERKASMKKMLKEQMREIIHGVMGRTASTMLVHQGAHDSHQSVSAELHGVDAIAVLAVLDALVRNPEGESREHVLEIIGKATESTAETTAGEGEGGEDRNNGEKILEQLLRANLVCMPGGGGGKFFFFLPATGHIKKLWLHEKKRAVREYLGSAQDGITELASVPATGPIASLSTESIPMVASMTTEGEFGDEHNLHHKSSSRRRPHHKSSRRGSTSNITASSSDGQNLMIPMGVSMDALPMSISHPGMWCKVRFLPHTRMPTGTGFTVLPYTRIPPHKNVHDAFMAATKFEWGIVIPEDQVSFSAKEEDGEEDAYEVVQHDMAVASCCPDGHKGDVYYFIHTSEEEKARHKKRKESSAAAISPKPRHQHTPERHHKHRAHHAQREEATPQVSHAGEVQVEAEQREATTPENEAPMVVGEAEEVKQSPHHRRRSASVPDDRSGHHRHRRGKEGEHRRHEGGEGVKHSTRKHAHKERATDEQISEDTNGGEKAEKRHRHHRRSSLHVTGETSHHGSRIEEQPIVHQSTVEVEGVPGLPKTAPTTLVNVASTTPPHDQQRESHDSGDIHVSPLSSPREARQRPTALLSQRPPHHPPVEVLSPITPPQPNERPPVEPTPMSATAGESGPNFHTMEDARTAEKGRQEFGDGSRQRSSAQQQEVVERRDL